MSAGHDRGLDAVRRVREARETDSRIGLQQALAVARAKEQAAGRAGERLEGAASFAGGSGPEFVAHRAHLDGLAREHREAEAAADGSRAVAAEATRRWQHDTIEAEVVRLLLERRAAERAAGRDRAETKVLDDLAAQAWQRTRGGRR